MNSIVKVCGLALLVGLAGASLSACAGGGGGGPVGQPPSPPPPPPPPDRSGASSSGGVVDPDAGRFTGDFGGPFGALESPQNGDGYAVDVRRNATPGSTDHPAVTLSVIAGDVDTLTITFLDAEVAFDGAMGSIDDLGGDVTVTSFGDPAMIARLVSFDAIDIEYAALLEVQRRTVTGIQAIGADLVSMPTSGAATFDTGLYGYFLSSEGAGDVGYFYARGDVAVDFGSGALSGELADVSWKGRNSATSAGGADFGLAFTAQISGDDFSGTMSTINGTVSLTGELEGDFYGPLGGAPEEIGGAFALSDSEGLNAAVGGLLGKAK